MRLRDYLLRKQEFAGSILPLLESINFRGVKKDDEEVKEFFRDGFYYRTRLWVYHDNGSVEVRIDRCNTEHFNVRYYPVVHESCFVYLRDSVSYKTTRKDITVGRYFIQYYQRTEAEQNCCFYCGRRFWYKCLKYKNHVKTKAHKENYTRMIEELAGVSRLNVDVVEHIMSYLF